MATSEAGYCLREDVLRASEVAEPATVAGQVDRLILAASRAIDATLNRRLTPRRLALTWPVDGRTIDVSGEAELVSVESVAVGAVATTATLGPAGGPPYDVLTLADTAPGGDVTVTGVWGYSDDRAPAGTLVGSLSSSATVTTLTVPPTAGRIGTGALVTIDTERLLVTDRTWLSVGTLVSPVGASSSEPVLALNAAGLAVAGEVLLIDGERVLVVDVTGSAVVVRRAVDGSVLVAHAGGATVAALRGAVLERGVCGTAPAAHLAAAPVSTWQPPAWARQWCIAETLNGVQQESSAYARTIGESESAREVGVRALATMRRDYARAFGRLRSGAI